jgi:hypothetical protein
MNNPFSSQTLSEDEITPKEEKYEEETTPKQEELEEKDFSEVKTGKGRVIASYSPIEITETDSIPITIPQESKTIQSDKLKNEINRDKLFEKLKEQVQNIDEKLSNYKSISNDEKKYEYTPANTEKPVKELPDVKDGDSFLIFPNLGHVITWIPMIDSQGNNVNKIPLNSRALLQFLDNIRSVGIPFETEKETICIKNFLKDVLKKILEFQYRDIDDAPESIRTKLKNGYIYENGIIYFDPKENIQRINEKFILKMFFSVFQEESIKSILESEKTKNIKDDPKMKAFYLDLARKILEIYDYSPSELSIKNFVEIIKNETKFTDNKEIVNFVLKYKPISPKSMSSFISGYEMRKKIEHDVIESKLNDVFEDMGNDIESILLGLPRNDDSTKRLNRNYTLLLNDIKATVNNDIKAFLPIEDKGNGVYVPPKIGRAHV